MLNTCPETRGDWVALEWERLKEVERGRHCWSFRLWALFQGPRDPCSSPTWPWNSRVTLGKLSNLCFLNYEKGMTPAPPSVL